MAVDNSVGQAKLGLDARVASANAMPTCHAAPGLGRPYTMICDESPICCFCVYLSAATNTSSRPSVREYLVAHPDITMDAFLATYSSSFCVSWPLHRTCIITRTVTGPATDDITINPEYEEHIRQLKHWTVAEAFRVRFPEIAELIDRDSRQP